MTYTLKMTLTKDDWLGIAHRKPKLRHKSQQTKNICHKKIQINNWHFKTPSQLIIALPLVFTEHFAINALVRNKYLTGTFHAVWKVVKVVCLLNVSQGAPERYIEAIELTEVHRSLLLSITGYNLESNIGVQYIFFLLNFLSTWSLCIKPNIETYMFSKNGSSKDFDPTFFTTCLARLEKQAYWFYDRKNLNHFLFKFDSYLHANFAFKQVTPVKHLTRTTMQSLVNFFISCCFILYNSCCFVQLFNVPVQDKNNVERVKLRRAIIDYIPPLFIDIISSYKCYSLWPNPESVSSFSCNAAVRLDR